MIALKLKNTKNFMSHLLLSDTFDNFLFIEGEIVTFNTFTIDGYIRKEFYGSDPDDHADGDYSSWKQLRELCFSMIKGKRTPLSFRFVFSLSPENITKLINRKALDFQASDVQGLYLNIRFDGTSLQCITGTSLKSFSMDKSLEKEWDSMVPRFFDKNGLAFEPED